MFTDAITIQSLSPDDEKHVLCGFMRLSADSRHLRWGMPLVRPGRVLDWVALLGQGQHFALGAWANETGVLVGVARYVRQGDSADVAVTVADDWQGRGVGTRLLEALLREACEHGLSELTASVRLENRRAMGLARRFGAPRGGHPSGGWADFEIPTLGCPPMTVSMASAC